MKITLIVKPEAIQDIISASSWYEGQRKGLGEKFEDHLWKSISLIEVNPYSFQLVVKNYR